MSVFDTCSLLLLVAHNTCVAVCIKTYLKIIVLYIHGIIGF
jgi:hypothetical protein